MKRFAIQVYDIHKHLLLFRVYYGRISHNALYFSGKTELYINVKSEMLVPSGHVTEVKQKFLQKATIKKKHSCVCVFTTHTERFTSDTMVTKCVYFLHTKKFSVTSTRYPKTQFYFDTNQSYCKPHRLRAQPHKTDTPTSDANHNYQVPSVSYNFCLTWLQIRGSQYSLLRFNRFLYQLMEFKETLAFKVYYIIKDTIKNTDKQLNEEIHRERSRKVPRA